MARNRGNPCGVAEREGEGANVHSATQEFHPNSNKAHFLKPGVVQMTLWLEGQTNGGRGVQCDASPMWYSLSSCKWSGGMLKIINSVVSCLAFLLWTCVAFFGCFGPQLCFKVSPLLGLRRWLNDCKWGPPVGFLGIPSEGSKNSLKLQNPGE